RAARPLVLAILFFPVCGLERWAFGVELGQDAALNPQRTALSSPVDPGDRHMVQAPPSLDLNGNRVDDRLEHRYQREHSAGPQAPGAPLCADVMICLDHPPTEADVARYRAMGATDLKTWGDLVYAVRARFLAALLPPGALGQLGQAPGVTWVE